MEKIRALRDGRCPITLNGEEHYLLFSLNVMADVEERCGGLENLTEEMNGAGRMKVIRWLLTQLLNEGAEEGAQGSYTEEAVGKLIHAGNFKDVQAAIYASMAVARGDDEEDDADDEDEDGEDGKNNEAGKA